MERYFILKLFQNEKVRNTYLPDILPHIFLDRKRRYVCFLMKRLYSENKVVTPDMVIVKMKDNDEANIAFKNKHFVPKVDEKEIFDMAFDETIDSSKDLIDIVYKNLLSSAFKRFVANAIFDMEEANDKYKHPIILAKARGIVKVYDIIYDRMDVDSRDQLLETQEFINNPEEYVRTNSRVLNTMMGGFTRGFVDTIGAKSGHTKSSWTDANALQNLLTGKVSKVLIISPEEPAPIRWRRIFASVCNIPISQMRQKSTQVEAKHIKLIRDKLDGKLEINDSVFDYVGIVKLMQDTDADMIYIDHLQSISYPGRRSALENMIGNIPGLVNIQKKIAKQKKIPIVNLSQVNDKMIQRSDRILKAPRYWDLYGSSILYQAARELLMLWYPIKDYENQTGISMAKPPSVNDIEMRIEKSSYSKTGRVLMNFIPDFNRFTDRNPKVLDRLSYVAPEEKDITQIELEL